MAAVSVRDACKRYGAHTVLDRLDMTVEKGTIYGLLGASGCGKTTLLSCIVGRRKLNTGDVWVLGGRPGSRGSGVPGPRIGYMPQDLSLMREFSIWDAVQHFAWIYGMSASKLAERIELLSKLLDLPPLSMVVKNLSGGQQRRVSLAVTLVHEPELVILDEPTVGLDPILRQNIWDHLLQIASQGRTIIITTHYIEEARQAHKIGLMRNAKLLAEGSPAELLTRFDCSTVEQVFLHLSSRQEAKPLPQQAPEHGLELKPRHATVPESPPDHLPPPTNVRPTLFFKNSGHAKALLSKNLYRIVRHPGAILFIFLFPMLQICTFYMSVGGWPRGLRLAVVNQELGELDSCAGLSRALGPQYGSHNTTKDELSYCVIRALSCQYLDLLNNSVAEKVFYRTLDEAMKDAVAGRVLGVLHFAANFSESFEARMHSGPDANDNATLSNSELVIHMDMSLRQSALLVEQKLRDTFYQLLAKVSSDCGIFERATAIPLNIQPPVFGQKTINFSLFMTPGVVITMIFFLSVGVTAMIIVVERLDGIWDRTLCAGVTSQEILLSHIIIETGVILLQTGEVFLFVFYIFQVPCLGSLLHIMLLLFLQGFSGMCGGFLVSVSCNSITASNFVSMGSFYPLLILSGLLWPTEGMPTVLRAISLALPTTLATTSMRNMMEKGWGMLHNHVYQGFLVSIVWICLFSAMSLIVIRLRK